MKELHALVDYENVQPTLEELVKLAPGFTDVWLFHGPHQAKRAQQMATAHTGVTLVPRSGKGPNALDFHLTFYLGYVAAKHPDAHLVVVANDKGYDPMISHARLLEFTVRRVGHRAKPPKTIKPATKLAVKSVVPAGAQISAPAAKAKPAPAKKAAPAKAPVAAKKAAAKKAPTKKAAAKKSASPKPLAAKVAAQPDAATSSDAKEFARIKNGLAKMGNKAPHKLKSFLRHVGAQLGKGSTAEQIDAMVEKLEKAGVVHIAGDLVLY